MNLIDLKITANNVKIRSTGTGFFEQIQRMTFREF